MYQKPQAEALSIEVTHLRETTCLVSIVRILKLLIEASKISSAV